MTVFTPTSERIATDTADPRSKPSRLSSAPVDVAELDELATRLSAESNPGRHAYNLAKRVLDVTVALALLIALSWLLLIVAVAIVLDSGAPVLFSQARVGRRGQRFNMLKFRTMREERRRRTSGPPPESGERRRKHKSAIDPRVTRAGRILRRTCLDELPQLWNVVRGEMSLVGPRPELPEIVARYEPWQHARHLVSPGITGWWQINRDERRLMHQATELDLHYVRHRSLWLDVLIMVRTANAVVRGRGAF